MVRSFNKKTPEQQVLALALARLEQAVENRRKGYQSLSTSKDVSMVACISSSVSLRRSA